MDIRRVSATFREHTDAEKAHRWLKEHGVNDDAIAIMSSNQTGVPVEANRREGAEDAKDMASDTAKGAAAGAGVGALFGLAALAIPGIGPFVAAGWLATALGTAAGAVVSGAIVGGTAGTVAGALTNAGYNKEDAERYGNDIQGGATFISVNVSPGSAVDADEIHDAFRHCNGRTGEV